MSLPISPIAGVALPESIQPAGQPAGGDAFREVFNNAIRTVEAAGSDASASIGRFLSGEGEELHITILTTQRAELSFEMFLEMRNKVVNAYQEIMRMPM